MLIIEHSHWLNFWSNQSECLKTSMFNFTLNIYLYDWALVAILKQLTVTRDQGDDDRCASGGALHQDREEDGNHQADNRVGQQGAALENGT